MTDKTEAAATEKASSTTAKKPPTATEAVSISLKSINEDIQLAYPNNPFWSGLSLSQQLSVLVKDGLKLERHRSQLEILIKLTEGSADPEIIKSREALEVLLSPSRPE